MFRLAIFGHDFAHSAILHSVLTGSLRHPHWVRQHHCERGKLALKKICMPSRREFLQAGIAASVLPITSVNPTLTKPDEAVGFYKVIFDERFPSSVAFGQEWKARGAAVYGIRGDITDLWFHDLDLQWKKRPVPIAGLTAHGPLFCLERLAWDHGMRVVSREKQSATHDDEPLIAWAIAPKPKSGGIA